MLGTDRAQWVKQIFQSLLDCPRGERNDELVRACGQDVSLRGEVQRLLDADDSGAVLLDTPAVKFDSELPAGAVGQGVQDIGGFEIVRLIGSGGMGDVYEARQAQPRRTVALKILRSGAASRGALRRFRAEADLLARLAHPGIAQVYAVGVHESGPFSVPYFAMEYVADAMDLLRHAESRSLDTCGRLRLFLDVCDAVQHGHERGVIHRDLKPCNILVGADGRPKVIDFGIAKAQDAGLATTIATDMGQLVGTLQYMSPEQLRGDSANVDMRSDVYALGLILYELLSGRRPHELAGADLAGAVLKLRGDDPQPLSAIRRDLRGDLSTIVAKAIVKERAERYATVSELMGDIGRYLANEPIAARSPSGLYLLRKLARRHRTVAVAVCFSACALAAGAALATWKAYDATRQRNAALLATRRAERINRFLSRVLSAADPRSSAADTTIREAMDRAAALLEAELQGDDEVAADVHHMIGSMFERMGEHGRAENHLRAGLAARLRGDAGGRLGEHLRDLAWVVAHRDADEAERLFDRAAQEFRLSIGPDSVDAVQARVSVAMLRINALRFADAEALARDALIELARIGKQGGGTAMLTHRTLAMALCSQSKMQDAEPHYREAVRLARAVFGDQHGDTAAALTAYAGFLEMQNRGDEAGTLRAEAAAIRLRLYGSGECPP